MGQNRQKFRVLFANLLKQHCLEKSHHCTLWQLTAIVTIKSYTYMLLRFKKIWDFEMGELSSIELEGAVGSRIYVLWADKESVVNFKYLQQKQFNLVILGYLSYCHWPLICTYCFCVKSLSEPSFVIIIKGTVHQPTKLLSYAQYAPNYAYLGAYLPNMHIWVHIWARQIWSSGVSLKRCCKMHFRGWS